MTLDLALRFIILLVRGAFDLNEKRMNATAHDQNILHVDTLYNIMISVTMNINTSHTNYYIFYFKKTCA